MPVSTFTCQWCGKEFERWHDRARSPKFCSRKCGAQTPRVRGQHNKSKTHCDHGHEFTPENTRYRSDGSRKCRKCVVDTSTRYKQRHAVASREWDVRHNDRSRDSATNHGRQWTGPEYEVAARAELSAAQVGEMIGRTVFAVKAARMRLKRDPRAYLRV